MGTSPWPCLGLVGTFLHKILDPIDPIPIPSPILSFIHVDNWSIFCDYVKFSILHFSNLRDNFAW